MVIKLPASLLELTNILGETMYSPMKKDVSKLRFGIMCDSYFLSAWQAKCIEAIKESGYAEPVLIIKHANKDTVKPFFRRLFQSRILFRLYNRYVVKKKAQAIQPVDMSETFAPLDQINCSVVYKGKFSQFFKKKDVAHIKEYNLDFILRFGFNIIRGDILNSARYGIWSYHHDDEQVYRGSPPCFWEIYNGDPKTGAILQRLTNRLDGGVILHKGYFKTSQISYSKNLDRVYWGAADWCARMCAEITHGQTQRFQADPSVSQAPIYFVPNNLQLLWFFGKCLYRAIKISFFLLFHLEIWNVGIAEGCLADIIKKQTIKNVKWVHPHKKRHFIADPFALNIGESCVVMVEDYAYSQRGKIAYFTLPEGFGRLNLIPAFERFEHMSYPYIFEDNGVRYCIPEVYQAKQVLIYRENGQNWDLKGSVLGGLPVIDPTLFKHNGHYWIFCTLQNDGLSGNQKLFAYYNDKMDGVWQAHALNPLKCDVGSCRPAGKPFVNDGKFYRPAQDCSETYGGAVVINQVTKLSPTEFEEEFVTRINPITDSPYSEGLHTVNELDGKIIIDGKRNVFDLFAWRWNYKHLR